MPSYRMAFLVDHVRNLTPPVAFAGVVLGNMEVPDDETRELLRDEVGTQRFDALERDGLTVVEVQVDAVDEERALIDGLRQATISVDPHALVFAEDNKIDFSRHRPSSLPNLLLIDESAEPPTVAPRYQAGPSLVRITAGAFGDAPRRFNASIVRRIASLYPDGLLRAGAERTALEMRVGRAVHWYSRAEEQRDPAMAFVSYWIGLEALTLHSSSVGQKLRKLSARLTALVLRHMPDTAEDDWKKVITDLWERRSDVVHEGLGATSSRLLPDVEAAQINEVRYLFFVALLHVLEQRAAGIRLDDLWHPRVFDAYRPGVPIVWADFPELLQSLHMNRTRRPATADDFRAFNESPDSNPPPGSGP